MSLENLKRELSSNKKKLSEETVKMEGDQKKADVLNSLYKKMKKKKEEMEALQKSLKNFSGKSYEYWQGNVFNSRYENYVKQELLRNGYGKMLSIIDDNLDEINNKRTYYENQIYKSKGIIGNLHAGINSIVTSIENLMN